MKDNSLSKISSTSMKVINLEQGDVLHFMKNSAESFKGFGEVYFSKINTYSIKGWKLHKKMTLNLIVPIGTVKFAASQGQPALQYTSALMHIAARFVGW